MSGTPPPHDIRILCVEDDPVSLKVLAGIARAVAREVFTAQDGREGMHAFAKLQPDLVISDIMMPRMNGVEMCQAIREIAPQTPIIFTTAFDDKDLLKQAISLSVEEYVVKPVDRQELIGSVERCAGAIAEKRRARSQADITNSLLAGLPHPALLMRRSDGVVLTQNKLARQLLGSRENVPCPEPFCSTGVLRSLPESPLDGAAVYAPSCHRDVKAANKLWDVTLSPVTGGRVILSAVDVTDRVQAERVRRDVERIVRHDMRTPISGIIGLAQLLSEGPLDDEQASIARMLYENGHRLLRMVSLPLDLYKMERGEYELSPPEVDLLEVLRQVTRELRMLADDRGQTLRVGIDGVDMALCEPLRIKAEDLHLTSIISNLVKNAIEAAPDGGVIALDITSGSPLTMHVHNPGEIPAPVRDRFFERYATYGKKGGTGLGTYSAKLIAKTYGGDVTFTSSPEHGTTLTVILPV